MPMQSGSGMQGAWYHCDCHQWQWPERMLSRQDGLIVCPLGRDNPQRTRTVDRRQAVIQQVLSDGKTEPSVADILLNTDDGTVDF